MKLFFYFFLFLIFNIVYSESLINCEELGFTDNLDCSSCDKLSAFVSNENLIEECQQCCHDIVVDEKVLYDSAKFVYNPNFISNFVDSNDFLVKYSKQFPRLRVVKSYTYVKPFLQLINKSKVVETLNIDTWKAENIQSYLNECLKQ